MNFLGHLSFVPMSFKILLAAILPTFLILNHAYAQDFTKSKFRQLLGINSSSSGANVRNDVYNFPLAISLNKENFNFEEANRDGSDIRFSKSKDTGLLAHSIEHWDRENKTAMIWVKMDVAGNKAAQPLFMNWGEVAAWGKVY